MLGIFGISLEAVTLLWRFTVSVAKRWRITRAGRSTTPSLPRISWNRRLVQRRMLGIAAWISHVAAPSESFLVNHGCARRSFGMLAAVTGALKECQWIQGSFNSFM